MSKELVPVNGHRPRLYKDETVARALVLAMETSSILHAHSLLAVEMKAQGMSVPDYSTVTRWVQADKDVMANMQGQEKRNMVALSSDVAQAMGERMIDTADQLSPSQMPVAYGIAMQRRTDWERPGGAGNTMAVQFNLVTRKDE